MTERHVLVRHPVAIGGALLAAVSAVAFIALVIAALAGLFRNPYAGLVVFVAIPACFVTGLLLIPLGMWLRQRQLKRHPAMPADWPVLDFRQASVRRTSLMIVALTAVNVALVLVAGYGGLHYMDSPGFCGQVCHAPMQPQFTAWQQASHGRVACAECHIGEGASGFVYAKLSGVRQLVQVATNSYPRPIPSGAHMKPGAQAQTCTGCHQPGRASGDHIRVIREYADDEKNTETLTVLQMHLGASSASRRAIHWHADPAVRVEYVSTDAERRTIPYVRVTDAKGSVKEYRSADSGDQPIGATSRRTMDCVDCHNVVGHPISSTAEMAADEVIAATLVSRDLPYARREGVRVLKASYPSQEEGARAIDRELRKFYASEGSIDQNAVERAVTAFQNAYRRNVFPSMNVTWGSYPSDKGHVSSDGCFRCHDDNHKTSDGSTISGDCEYCHTQIERPAGRP